MNVNVIKLLVFSVPKSKTLQDDQFILDNALSEGSLDCMHASKIPTQSIDQPGHGTCILSATVKWT